MKRTEEALVVTVDHGDRIAQVSLVGKLHERRSERIVVLIAIVREVEEVISWALEQRNADLAARNVESRKDVGVLRLEGG